MLILLLCFYVGIDVFLHISGYHTSGLASEHGSRRRPPFPRGRRNLTASPLITSVNASGYPKPHRQHPPSHVATPALAQEGPFDRGRGTPGGVTPPGEGPRPPLPTARAVPFIKADPQGAGPTKGGTPRGPRRATMNPPKPAPDPALTDAVKQRMITEYESISIVYTWINVTDPRDREMRMALGRKGPIDKCQEDGQLRYSMRFCHAVPRLTPIL